MGYIAPIKNFIKENSIYLDYPPNKTVNGYNIFIRPNLNILFNCLFYEVNYFKLKKKRSEFDVGIWACQDKDQSAFQIETFFETLKYNLKFALFTKNPNPTPFSNSIVPIPIKRDLNIIFQKHKEYDLKNTLIISNYKNELSQFRENDIVIPLYHPSEGTTTFNLDAHMYYLMEYLQVINSMRLNDACKSYYLILKH